MIRLVLILLLFVAPMFAQVRAPFQIQIASVEQLPLKVSDNDRYLAYQDGTPFFAVADSPWSLFAQLHVWEARLYFNNRDSIGFNSMMINLPEHFFTSNAPNNILNQAPFSGTVFTTPSEAYFDHADSMIAIADSMGFILFIAPIYLGYDCGEQGWGEHLSAVTAGEMGVWGEWIGDRLKDFDNIVYLMGGDTNPNTCYKAHVDSTARGIMRADPNAVILAAHNQPESYGMDPWESAPWITLDNIYTYTYVTYTWARNRYSRPRPFYFLEGSYESEGAETPLRLRQQMWHSTMWGSTANFFGNDTVWELKTGWQTAMLSPGSDFMGVLASTISTFNWHTIIPDTAGNVITSGAGTYGVEDYTTVGYGSDSSFIAGYLPSNRAPTIDPSVMNLDSVFAYWKDPENGDSTYIGTYNKDAREYTPPGAGDWVLILKATD